MPKIVPCLWFDTEAEEAARFHVSVFPNSTVTGVTRYGPGAHRPEGLALTVSFTLDGQEYLALNSGPEFTFSDHAEDRHRRPRARRRRPVTTRPAARRRARRPDPAQGGEGRPVRPPSSPGTGHKESRINGINSLQSRILREILYDQIVDADLPQRAAPAGCPRPRRARREGGR